MKVVNGSSQLVELAGVVRASEKFQYDPVSRGCCCAGCFFSGMSVHGFFHHSAAAL